MSGCDCPSRGESPHSMDCAMTAPEPVAPPAQDELREALIRAWNHSEWIVKGSGEDRRIVMADTAERFDALLAGPLAGLVIERDAAEDFRHDMAMQAYTAPDAAPDTIRQSLAARIADLVAERDALRARLDTITSPCRGCDSPTMLDGLHIYGERKCCPDCDHRAALGGDT